MKRAMIIFTILILALISASGVCAADTNDTALASDDVSQIEITATDNNNMEITEVNGQAKVESNFFAADDALAQGNDIDNKLGDGDLKETWIDAEENASYATPTVSKNTGYYEIKLYSNDTVPVPLTNKTLSIEFNNNKTKINTASGSANYIIPNDTTAGKYPIKIAFDGEEGYAGSSFETMIEIHDEETQIIAPENANYSHPLVIESLANYLIYLKTNTTTPQPIANKTVIINCQGIEDKIKTNEYGLINYTIPSEVSAGVHIIEIEYEGGDGYVGSSFINFIEIYDEETQIIAPENAIYPPVLVSEGLGYYSILLATNTTIPQPIANKTVTISFNGNTNDFITNEFGIITYSINPNTAEGSYPIYIKYSGGDGYLASSFTANITIHDIGSQIIALENVSYPRTLVVEGLGNYSIYLATNTTTTWPIANKTVSISFNNKTEEFTTNEFGVINYIISPDTAVGSYALDIIYSGGEGYIASNFTANITIHDIGSQIIALENVSYPRTLVVEGLEYYSIYLATNTTTTWPIANKTVSISFNGKTEEFTTNEFGVINYTLSPNTAAGTHPLKIIYAGGDGYIGTNFTATISLYDIETQIISADSAAYSYSEIADGSATYSLLLITDITSIPIANKNVYIEINGIGDNFTTNLMGVIDYTLPKLSAGNYSMNILFKEDGGYATSNKTAKIAVVKSNSTLTVNDIEFDYKASGSTTVLITNARGVVAEVVNQSDAIVNVEGNNIIVSNLSAGTYTLSVTTITDENYNPVTKTAIITVNKLETVLVAKAVTVTYNANKNLVITLKDSKGNAISGVKLTVKIKGSKTYTTDKNGQVKISTKKLAPKKYTVEITFNGDANYAKSTKSVKVTIKKAKPKIKAKKKTFKKSKKVKKYTVTLKYNKKKPIKKAKLTLKVKGKTYKAKTNSKGKATFKIKKLKKGGKFKAIIKYKGNKYFKKVTKKSKITVK